MDLKELLGEELYSQVMEKAGDQKIDIVSNGNWFPKSKFDEVNENAKELKKQLKDRDTQLEDLKTKATGNEELTAKIQELTDLNKQTVQDYEQKIQDQAFNFALREALTGAKAKNPKAVEALLNRENLKLDGEKIIGLDDQLKALQESDSYLFDVQQQQEQGREKPRFSTGQHESGGTSDPFAAALLGKTN